MLSSGASTLLQAEMRGKTLFGIKKRSFAELVGEHSESELKRLQDNIVQVLEGLQGEGVVAEGKLMEMDFAMDKAL